MPSFRGFGNKDLECGSMLPLFLVVELAPQFTEASFGKQSAGTRPTEARLELAKAMTEGNGNPAHAIIYLF
jgi:hypothetical protein